MLDGMTNIKASEVLKEIKYYTEDLPPYSPDEVAEALEMAIKALEQLQDVHDTCKNCIEFSEFKQQPCEDCISRQAALDCFEQTNTRQGAKYAIETLPSVKPQYSDEEIDKAQAVEQAYVDKMVELAVEETKRPKGKWIEYKVDIAPHPLHCSLCGFSNHHISNRYMREFRRCPNCGAEMEVEE